MSNKLMKDLFTTIKMISDDDLSNLLNEIEEINNNQPLTFFEAINSCIFPRM